MAVAAGVMVSECVTELDSDGVTVDVGAGVIVEVAVPEAVGEKVLL